jgi:putative ABC transport system permease protein
MTANAVAMSIRERWREIGVLKTPGYQKGLILKLLVGEAIALDLAGTLCGTLSAVYFLSHLNMGRITSGFIQHLRVGPDNFLLCLLIGVGGGIIASLFPAWRASQRSAVEAIRRVA